MQRDPRDVDTVWMNHRVKCLIINSHCPMWFNLTVWRCELAVSQRPFRWKLDISAVSLVNEQTTRHDQSPIALYTELNAECDQQLDDRTWPRAPSSLSADNNRPTRSLVYGTRRRWICRVRNFFKSSEFEIKSQREVPLFRIHPNYLLVTQQRTGRGKPLYKNVNLDMFDPAEYTISPMIIVGCMNWFQL